MKPLENFLSSSSQIDELDAFDVAVWSFHTPAEDGKHGIRDEVKAGIPVARLDRWYEWYLRAIHAASVNRCVLTTLYGHRFAPLPGDANT